MSDRNFDGIADRFKRNVYDSPKGELRLAVIWEDMLRTIPAIEAGQPLRVLDAGGGMGQIAGRLAELGHQVVLCDISAEMLSLARDELGDRENIIFVQRSVQEMAEHEAAGFDLVVCHALLEWVADQQKVLACLDRLLGDEAYLSLCFYNIHGTIFKNLIKGNFKKVADGDLAGFPGSLTPPHPLDPDEVERWLAQLGLRQLGKTGIRVIHDYLFPKAACSMEEILEMERKFCRREPYRSLGRYIHIPCRKISL